MNTSDRDGLSRAQIERINRIELARYQKAKRDKDRSWLPVACFLFGIWLVIGFAVVMVERRWNPGSELVTSLSRDLDQQTPSITIRGDQ